MIDTSNTRSPGMSPLRSSAKASRKVIFFIAKSNKEDLVVLQELLEAGRVTPVVERSYPLSEAADALRYLGEGHARGSSSSPCETWAASYV